MVDLNLHRGHRWYALHVRARYELSVASRLQELGVQEYLPVQRSRQVTQRNRCSEGLPLFPGYVFSFINLSTGPKLYSIPGVLRIVGQGRRAIPIEDDEIATVRTLADSQLLLETTPYFHSGARICLVAGPLKGVSGTFLHTDKGDKLVVSLPLLKRSLAVTVLRDWVALDVANVTCRE